MNATPRNAVVDDSLTRALGECSLYPEAFPALILPWGKAGHRLEHKTLRVWQREFLADVGQQVRDRRYDPFGTSGRTTVDAIRLSTASGHGIGKSALVALLTLWVHACWPESRVLITANTATQLKTRTWAAVGEWFRMSILRSRSTYLASRGNMRLYNNQHPESWDAVAYTAAAGQEESLQGQHSRSISAFIADEASLMPPEVMNAVKGAMVGGMGLMAFFGNPTRNSGPFYDTHHRERNLWVRRKINSKDVEDTDGPQLDAWIEQYGWDSDFVKVRIRGEFPSTSSLQFIPGDDVEACMEFEYEPTIHDPLIYGCDVAHTGEDSCVLVKRHGRKVMPDIVANNEWRVEEFYEVIVTHAMRDRPDAIFVDGGGVGAMLPGMLRQALPMPVYEVNAAGRSPDRRYGNRRAYCWGKMKDAVRERIDLPSRDKCRAADTLHDDLISLEYGYRIADNAIMLERKDEAKKRGVASPDFADALSLTYSHPVPFKETAPVYAGDRPGGILSPMERDRGRVVSPHLGMRERRGGHRSVINPRWRA